MAKKFSECAPIILGVVGVTPRNSATGRVGMTTRVHFFWKEGKHPKNLGGQKRAKSALFPTTLVLTANISGAERDRLLKIGLTVDQLQLTIYRSTTTCCVGQKTW